LFDLGKHCFPIQKKAIEIVKKKGKYLSYSDNKTIIGFKSAKAVIEHHIR
jgi:hypothetical protein